MTKLTLPRAATQVAALLCFRLLMWASPASAFTAANTKKGTGEETPLNFGSPSTSSHPSSSTGGASIVRTIVGLAIVLGVIWGLAWILRQVKGRRDPRVAATGLTSVAALPLSSGRSVHLVKAGNDYLLLGSAEHGLMPIHRYTEQQALEAGLLSPEEPLQPRKRRINLGLLTPPAREDDHMVRPVSGPRAALPPGTPPSRPRPTRTLDSGERQSDPMHMPTVSSSLIERLRELTVRR
jgi:flagellar protein FliO/FliZ